jgi:chromosome segregation ATPase
MQGFERFLLALSILGAALVVGNEVFNHSIPQPSLEKLEGTQQADPGKLDDISSQLARAGDQLKTSQNRVGQLEDELTQTRAELDATRKGAENIRSSAASANAEPPISQATVASSSGTTTKAVSPAVSHKEQKPNVRGRSHKMEAAGPRPSRTRSSEKSSR